MNRFLIIICLLIVKSSHAQYIKLSNGLLISSFNNNTELIILEDKAKSYFALVGIEYSEKKWFHLSSQIGYLKVGGKSKIAFDNNNVSYEEQLSEYVNFIHANTTFRIHKKIVNNSLKLFGGVGPYLNILADSKNFDNPLYKNYNNKALNSGVRTEIGITQEVKKIRIGLVGSYMLNISPTSYSDNISIYNNGLGFELSIGYKI